MYVGCGTGVSYKVGNTSYNLVSATYKKGAHFVLGTEDEVKTAKASEWINDFSYKASKSGSTIADCLSYANYYIGNIPVCTAGDKNCRLNY
ncbi:MAG: hypothetical protein Q4F05_05715 [bacterium]|nr:hypothetical protein [bacterium]